MPSPTPSFSDSRHWSNVHLFLGSWMSITRPFKLHGGLVPSFHFHRQNDRRGRMRLTDAGRFFSRSYCCPRVSCSPGKPIAEAVLDVSWPFENPPLILPLRCDT